MEALVKRLVEANIAHQVQYQKLLGVLTAGLTLWLMIKTSVQNKNSLHACSI